MQRVAFILKVRQDRLEEYKIRHAEVWPDMLQALRETGWHNYSIFMRPDGMLFGYLETPDFEAARAGMADREVNARWQADMAPFFESLTGNPDEAMLPLEEVFQWERGTHYIKAGTGKNAPLRFKAVEIACWFANDRKLEVKL
ncbi:MAG: L-rhamnose mutarotase [Proteobacteria bacterium]|nr:L-rhamnose mutarotase [Pseudomonadota bacterium]